MNATTVMSKTSLIEDLSNIVGRENIVSSEDALSGLLSGAEVSCIVKPGNTGEVQNIVRLANEKKFALIPVSSHKKEFTMDNLTAAGDIVIIDLSRMKSILRIDRRNKLAMIEPGVTFGELQDAANREGMRLMMPLLPESTQSVLSSYLEREPTVIPKYHWDMTNPMLCTEVIFGTGDYFRTGSAAGPGTLEEQREKGQAQRNPMGPAQVDYLRILQAAQGTMGIVTWCTLKLELLPQVRRSFMVAADSLDTIIDFTYSILKRKLPDECLIFNNIDLASLYGKDGGDCNEMSGTLPSWVLVYSIAGYEYLPEERVAYIEKDIADIAAPAGIVQERHVSGISADKLVALLSRPGAEPGWRNRKKGASRDIFFLTTLDRVSEFLALMDDEARKHGFDKDDIGVYIQPIQQGRNCHLEFNLMHDPAKPGDAEKAGNLFESASMRFMDRGGFFSRPYGIWAEMAYSKCPDTVSGLKKLKNILDPKGVLNPGKLCFGKEE